MSIWYHGEATKSLSADKVISSLCFYCRTPLERDQQEETDIVDLGLIYGFTDEFRTNFTPTIGICPACGRWLYAVQRQ
ncbi:MAG: hypothetical protein H7Y17_10750 [Chlorobia bacterium]|nr:hypothetical protein [Fimbriimonadaceae bacterium]